MSKVAIFVGFIFLLFFLIPSSSSAIDFETLYFALDGTGSFMDSPPKFSGDIIAGDLYPGTFWVAFDDTGWPTSENERFDYFFSHYFIYDDSEGNEGWDGYFPPVGSGEDVPRWHFYTASGDTLGGDCTGFIITIRDYDGDGMLDDNEYQSKVMSTNLLITFSAGCYAGWCGQGNFHGDLDLIDEVTWEEQFYVPSASSATGILSIRNGSCDTGTEKKTWGEIKSIYE